MKLKSTMKHRHLQKVSLFILSLLTIILVYKPFYVYAQNYETTHYSVTVWDDSEIFNAFQNIQTTNQTKIKNTYIHIKYTFDGIYNGTFNIRINNILPSNFNNIVPINCVITDITFGSNNANIHCSVYGQGYFEIVVHVSQSFTNSVPMLAYQYSLSDSSETMDKLTSSEIQTLLNMKNSLYNLERYTDQLETLLSGINTDMSYVRSTLNDIYNRAGYIVNQLTDIKNNTDTSNSLLTDIKTILSNMDFTTTPTEQTELQTFNTQNNTVQNIQSNLINHLTDTVDGTRTTPQYLEYQLVNNRDLQSYNLLNTLYTAINWPPITSGIFVQILRLIFMFIIIGVILG